MALWAYIPNKTLISVLTELPSMARRLDTGELVADVAQWSAACGYWDIDSPTVAADVQAAKQLTTAEFNALAAEVASARALRITRRAYIESQRDEWAAAKGVDLDWLDEVPPYQVPDNGPMPTGPDTLATLKSQVLWMYGRHEARITYLYDHERRLTNQLIGVGDLVVTLAMALLAELERSETFHPPGTIF